MIEAHIINLPDDLPQLAEMARRNNTLHAQWVKKVKRRKPTDFDEQVHDLHDEAFAHIDCLQCANCCRTLGPRITDRDIERLAKHLRVRPADVIEKYLRIDEDKDYVFRSMPCPFLMPDNYCSVYEHRPRACREYPHTDRVNFHQILDLTLRNVPTCPAVYAIVQTLANEE